MEKAKAATKTPFTGERWECYELVVFDENNLIFFAQVADSLEEIKKNGATFFANCEKRGLRWEIQNRSRTMENGKLVEKRLRPAQYESALLENHLKNYYRHADTQNKTI